MTVSVEPLAVDGAWVMTPRIFSDHRGDFLEWFSHDRAVAAIGQHFAVAQANLSVSAKGVVRGIHFADVPPGQAKYVTCVRGAVWDVVVDLRVGSPTWGRWQGVQLDDATRRAVYIPEGVGHGFMALSDDASVSYLCSTPYAPEREHEVHPHCPDLAIEWPTAGLDGAALTPILSDKDAGAPTTAQARERGILPTWEAFVEHRTSPPVQGAP